MVESGGRDRRRDAIPRPTEAWVDASVDRPPPRDPPAPDLGPSAGQVLRAQGGRCLVGLQASREAFLKAPSSEPLHEIRVALRRMRTLAVVYRDLLPARGRAARSEMKWLTDELDDARDLDVFVKAAGPAPALRQALSAARIRAYARAGAALSSARGSKLMTTLEKTLAAPGAQSAVGRTRAAAPAREAAASALKRWRKRLGGPKTELAALSPTARHELRLRAKKVRYAAELLGDLFGQPTRQRRFAAALRRLQDLLGDLNDIPAGAEVARRLALQSDAPEAAFEAGVLAGAGAGREKSLIKKAQRAYARFWDAHPFW